MLQASKEMQASQKFLKRPFYKHLLLKNGCFWITISFARVPFSNASGFYCKQNRQLFYHQRTAPYPILKIYIKLVFQNTFGSKNSSKVTKKKHQKLLQLIYPSVYIISFKQVSQVCDGVCFYWSFRLFLKMESVTESVFSFGLWMSLFLVKL